MENNQQFKWKELPSKTERIWVNATRYYYNRQIQWINNEYDKQLEYTKNENVEHKIEQLITLHPELEKDLVIGATAFERLYYALYNAYAAKDNMKNNAYGRDPDWHPSQEQPENQTRKDEDDNIIASTKEATAKTEAIMELEVNKLNVQVLTFNKETKHIVEKLRLVMSQQELNKRLASVLSNKDKYISVRDMRHNKQLMYTYNHSSGETRTTQITWKEQ